MHFVEVHYNLNINKWTMSKDIPCNASMNEKYDEHLYRRLNEMLVARVGCTVPFLPDEITSKSAHPSEICKGPHARKKAYAFYDLLKRNKENKVCPNPCSSIQVYFGVMFEDAIYNEDLAYIQIYLQSTTNINFTV